MTRTSATLPLLALLLGAGCTASPHGGGPGEPDPEDAVLVPDGKQDDFLSLSADEYVVSGRTTVVIEPELEDAVEEARLERVRELASYKQIAIAWFLTQYLLEKDEDDANADYGGYEAMARNNTYDELDIRHEDGRTYSFYFEQLVAGNDDLLDLLPGEHNADGTKDFVLTIGAPSNEELARLETNGEWYRSSPWSPWNPESVDESRKEDLELSIRYEEDSDDAWFDYPALFEDGVMDVDVHFGWDYHSDYHIKHARALFRWLENHGYEAPVDDFDLLAHDSGPFTNTMYADGRDIRVEVRIFYGKDGSESDPNTDEGGRLLEQNMRHSLATRDVIVFSGHSGPFYGFALANWRTTSEGDLDDSEMSSVEMPEERYQVILAEGCDTYQVGEGFRNNPAKPEGRYVDIITTTAPSDAGTPAAVQDTIARLTETDAEGRHRPKTIKTLLDDLDDNSWWAHTMYGVHGIDDNPQLHPWADLDAMGERCLGNDDCGGPGNRCVRVSTDAKRCAPSCTTDAACGDGRACRDVASAQSRTIFDAVCY